VGLPSNQSNPKVLKSIILMRFFRIFKEERYWRCHSHSEDPSPEVLRFEKLIIRVHFQRAERNSWSGKVFYEKYYFTFCFSAHSLWRLASFYRIVSRNHGRYQLALGPKYFGAALFLLESINEGVQAWTGMQALPLLPFGTSTLRARGALMLKMSGQNLLRFLGLRTSRNLNLELKTGN